MEPEGFILPHGISKLGYPVSQVDDPRFITYFYVKGQMAVTEDEIIIKFFLYGLPGKNNLPFAVITPVWLSNDPLGIAA